MRVTTSIIQNSLKDSAEIAAFAEARGYDGVTTQENNHEPFMPLAVAALNTERVELETAIALAFPRSPTIVAHTAWDLNVASAGRFSLGLGSQVKGHNERRFSVPWTAPQPRLRDYIHAIRDIWRCWELGDELNHESDHYQITLMPPNFRPPPSGLRPIPITIAALGPAMMRLAGHHCDGVRLHPFCTRKYLENVVLPEIETGRARGGVARENFEISGGGFLATGPDEESVQKMVEFARYRIAFYGSTRTYHKVFEQHDLVDLGLKLHAMSKADQWDDMADEVPLEVVELFTAIGTYDTIAEAVQNRYGTLVDTLAEGAVPGVRPDLPAEVIGKIRAIESPFIGFRSNW